MKNVIYLIIIAFFSVSCTALKVSSDYDRTAGFGSYKTYSFIVYPENLPYDREISSTVISSVASEMTAKGMKKSENPDIFIDLKARVGKNKTVASSSTGEYPNFYGTGYIYTWGAGFSTATINFNSYSEGTLFIDIIDARNKQLVWQGRGVGKIKPDESPTQREKNAAEVVKKIMAKYPPKP